MAGKHIVHAYRNKTSGKWQSLSGQCEAVEMHTLIKESVYNGFNFKGLGVWTSKTGNSFITKRNLRPSFKVDLKSGQQAYGVVILTAGHCYGLGGNGGSLYNRYFEFKPWSFEIVPNQYGKVERRTWDWVDKNYRLGRTKDGKGFIRYFDRSRELLK
jgi:hypothetical protein